MGAKRIGFVGFDGVVALDIFGPAEAFTSALEAEGGGGRLYEVVVLGVTRKPFRATSGIVIQPNASLREASVLDTVIVPGGPGLRSGTSAGTISQWIAANAHRVRRIASVCTGIYGVAPSGVLDGRRVTTHWAHARDVAQRFPKLKLEADSLYRKDDKFYSSAGITAGIDLALALIEEDHGPSVAMAVARELVVYMKRPGGQEQYSESLRFQVESTSRMAEIAAWIANHLHGDLRVETLAERARVCPRQFTRQFKAELQVTPAAFVEAARLDEARRRLSTTAQSVEHTAESVGFGSADAFRRAFERRFGVSPRHYRSRFSMNNNSKPNEVEQ